ncbi:MAG: LysE family translocator [Pseudomonadota bacterium]
MSLEFLITALIVCLVPGTGVLYTLSVALTRSRMAMVAAVVGCTLGIVPHLLAAILGLAAILHASALAFEIVKYAGVAFLLYLAWQTLKERGALEVGTTDVRGFTAIAVRGTLLNVLNPKLSIFFLAFLPQFISTNSANPTLEMLGLGAVFMALTALVFLIYGISAGLMRDRVLSSPRLLAWVRGGMAAAFTALAGRLALERA